MNNGTSIYKIFTIIAEWNGKLQNQQLNPWKNPKQLNLT